MNGENAADESETVYRGMDPVNLEIGDEVIVKDVTASEPLCRGEVLERDITWGRVSITILEENGDESIVHEETGRTWARIEEESA